MNFGPLSKVKEIKALQSFRRNKAKQFKRTIFFHLKYNTITLKPIKCIR